jgi:ssDNA-binding Zn-finger/Zn-ribbon topoisomerase 1
MEGSEGNSLKEQNPTWAEQKVPTMNPGSLEFPSVTKPSKFEGSGDGSLEYTVDWEELENPSEGLEDVSHPQIPTQMPSMPHKTTKTVAASKDEEEHDVECTACGTSMRMSESAMNNEATRCANKDCPTNKDASENDKDMNRKSVVNDVDKATELAGGAADAVRNVNNGAQKATEMLSQGLKANASLDLARIKTSYSCATKLALAGIITSEEVDSYAEQMINDGLKSDSMIRQTKLLLKSAQSSTERVAAAAAERMSTRTASTLGVSTSPALSGGLSNNSAALDIQGALKGTWTMPNIED